MTMQVVDFLVEPKGNRTLALLNAIQKSIVIRS